MNDAIPAATREDYHALTQSVGYREVFDRCHIELTGNDRVSFLHNLCTNDIKRLEPGRGCEAFLCDVQGKVVGFVFVFCTAESLVLESSAGQGEHLIQHLDRYLIREDVTLRDRSDDWGQCLLSGPESADALESLGVASMPVGYLDHVAAPLADSHVFVRRTNWTSESAFCIAGPRPSLSKAAELLRSAGVRHVDNPALEIARIERGSPIYGVDITHDNLPQEVNRDGTAISFDKGCYLGQETVARIDALGHVNWNLLGLRHAGQPLPVGKQLTVDGKVVARVTSSAHCPRLDGSLAMAYVRRGHERPGAMIVEDDTEFTVVAIPLIDETG